MASCSGCTEEWTAETLCHCGGCHRTFHSPASFDRHRNTMKGLHGTCLDPAANGLRLRRRYGNVAWGVAGEGTIVRKSPGKTVEKPTNTVGVG
jgi:hypothetical protein